MKILSKDAEIKRLVNEYYNQNIHTHYYYENALKKIDPKIVAFCLDETKQYALLAYEENLNYKKIKL